MTLAPMRNKVQISTQFIYSNCHALHLYTIAIALCSKLLHSVIAIKAWRLEWMNWILVGQK
jgi:hypothetical protein